MAALLLISFLLLVILVSMLEFANVTHFFRKPLTAPKQTLTTGGASTGSQKGETQNSTNGESPANTQSAGTSKGNTAPVTSLIAPSGDFVSNHTPGQNGSSQIETSVCNTTSGAKCQISFTMNGKTISLSAETTDAGGSAYWNDWTPQSIGLTPGSWQIAATATLGGQTKATTDPRSLVVMQ